MRKLVICFAMLLSGTAYINAQTADSSKYLSLEPYDFHMQYLHNDSAMLIDVREFFEYKGNRIKGALNIPSSGNTEFSADTIDKSLSLFFYCSTGFRSKKVAELFHDKGFLKIHNLEGGIVAWKRDGFPVEKKKVRRRRR